MKNVTGDRSDPVMGGGPRIQRQIVSSDSVPDGFSREKIMSGRRRIMTFRNFRGPERRNEEKYFNSRHSSYHHGQRAL